MTMDFLKWMQASGLPAGGPSTLKILHPIKTNHILHCNAVVPRADFQQIRSFFA
jgi:hypothetical protein